MQAEVPAGEIKNLTFSFVDASNMDDHADGHIHSLAIAFEGKDQMTQVGTWRQDGHSSPMPFTLERKKYPFAPVISHRASTAATSG